ncbi:MAG TPA: GNAT family N-acetyltransferase [Candidatus Saccharimonadales bacterium]|nr:GNAT family N-acetyltransferase [Candidatus Saccharimonadales bacterium]
MKRSIADGSAYWIAPDQKGDYSSQRALVKTTPSRAFKLQKTRLQAPNCYLNDIVVAPGWQSKCIGKTMLFAALTSGEFDMRRSLALDAFEGNDRANSWFRRLGMHAVEGPGSFVIEMPSSDSVQLPQVRYTSEGQATLEDIASSLESAGNIAL